MVYVEDKLLAGKKARRPTVADDALSENEWVALQAVFSAPVRRLWDMRPETLIKIYAMPNFNVKAAVDVGRFKVRDAKTASRAATIYRVTEADIENGLQSGWFEPFK